MERRRWETADWCWCEQRLFRSGPDAGAVGDRTCAQQLEYHGVAVYLVLCSYLGAETAGTQTAYTRVTSIATLLKMEAPHCWKKVKQLRDLRLIDFDGDDRGFAFTLLGAGDPQEVKPRRLLPGKFFWLDRRVLNARLELRASGLAVYGLLAANANNTGECFCGEQYLKEQLRLGKAYPGNVAQRLQQAGLLQVHPPKRQGHANGYTLLDLSGGE